MCVFEVSLRYTVSECLFAFPAQRISISNPCVVTCEPLADAIEYQLSNDSSSLSPSLSFCNDPDFSDVTINNCAFCYGLIPEQLFLANSKHLIRYLFYIRAHLLTQCRSVASPPCRMPAASNTRHSVLPRRPNNLQRITDSRALASFERIIVFRRSTWLEISHRHRSACSWRHPHSFRRMLLLLRLYSPETEPNGAGRTDEPTTRQLGRSCPVYGRTSV